MNKMSKEQDLRKIHDEVMNKIREKSSKQVIPFTPTRSLTQQKETLFYPKFFLPMNTEKYTPFRYPFNPIRLLTEEELRESQRYNMGMIRMDFDGDEFEFILYPTLVRKLR